MRQLLVTVSLPDGTKPVSVVLEVPVGFTFSGSQSITAISGVRADTQLAAMVALETFLLSNP